MRGMSGSRQTLKAKGDELGFLILRICATSTVKGPVRCLSVNGCFRSEMASWMGCHGGKGQHTPKGQLERLNFDRHGD